jgi:hypothetical protein
MVMINSDSIEKFIRENRDKFGTYPPPEKHWDRFLLKLNLRLRHIISIVPYLMRVAVFTVIIFTGSVIIWNSFIRKDRNEIKLRDKIEGIIRMK